MTADKISARQKIIAAAKNLFSTHGYSQATIDDIITAAGITKGAFYYYFKSKEAICIEIIDEVKIDYQDIFDSLPKEFDPFEKLKAAIRQIIELNSSGQWVNCKLILHISSQTHVLQSPIKQKLDSFWKWYIEQYLQLIIQCRDLNLIGKKFSAEQQVEFIVSVLVGNTWTRAVFNNGMDIEFIDYIIERL
jgi:TetR/AcrR family transcriptional regulator, transcriptional repressor for nem operon